MIRKLIIIITMGGTLFFCSVHFVDTQVLPKWIVFAVGGMIWSVVSCAHHLVPFDRCALLPHKCIHYAIVGLIINECPHVTKLAKFKLPSCPKTMFWNTLCKI